MSSLIAKAPPWILTALAITGAYYIVSDWWGRQESIKTLNSAIESLATVAGQQQSVIEKLTDAEVQSRGERRSLDERLDEVEKDVAKLLDRWDRMSATQRNGEPVGG